MVIVPGMLLQQFCRITSLPGAGARRQPAADSAHLSPRVIVLHPYECAARVRRCAHAPQEVAEEMPRSLVAAPHADNVGAEAIEVRHRVADGALPEVGDGDDSRRRVQDYLPTPCRSSPPGCAARHRLSGARPGGRGCSGRGC